MFITVVRYPTQDACHTILTLYPSALSGQSKIITHPSEEAPKYAGNPPHSTPRSQQRREIGTSTERLKAPSKTISREKLSSPPQRPAPSVPEPREPESAHVQSKPASTSAEKRSFLVRNAKSPPSLEGVVDLNSSEDTTVATRWDPAVTHQTVHKDIHNIREEYITREIHTHDYFHRILPIVDVEVLPPRHFVPSATNPSELVEISGNAIPGRRDDEDQKMRNWFIARSVEDGEHGQVEVGGGPRRFTAREFRDGEGDHHEWVGADGVQRSTTTWVHPPAVEDGGKRSGQTVPFHIGSADPSQDGFRAEDFYDGQRQSHGYD